MKILKSFIFALLLFIIILLYSFNSKSNTFSEHQNGIIDKINVVYLTLDICGGKTGIQPDLELIRFLKENKIKATFFINARFLENKKNAELVLSLSKNPLFSIQNHGKEHKPASIDGKSIYGIEGTKNKEELIEEIMYNHKKLLELTGKAATWYRSGTAYYDTEAIEIIIDELKYKIAGFAITLDKGATLSSENVFKRMLQAKNGDLLLAHANHPESGTREGLKLGIKALLEKGYKFELLN